MAKKLIAGLAAGACLLAFVELGAGQAFEDTRAKQYVGNVNTLTYHCINCQEAKKIARTERAMFSSAEEAVKSGCKPCNICRPPAKD